MEIIDIFLGEDNIYTDSVGIKQIMAFYADCKHHKDKTVIIRLDNLNWLDGNLCALLGALLFRLKNENNLTFKIDPNQVEAKCNILFHNDFLPLEEHSKTIKKSSCIPFKGFYPKQKDEFTDYLENDLLSHQSMPQFNSEIKEKLIDDLIEIYGNIDKHAQTDMPFFVCGQYFHKQGIIRFTICDLGIGFYEKIKQQQPEIIQSTSEAILWAVAGNSTKPDAPGGSGLKTLHEYLSNNKGGIQIFSIDANWCSKTMEQNVPLRPKGITQISNIFKGSVISLEFNKKTLLS